MQEKIKEILQYIKENAFNTLKFSGFAFLISFFGAFAGSKGTSKNWRRIGIPVTFLTCAVFSNPVSWWLLTILLQHGILRMGYGIQDSTDEGSMLGSFFYRICKGNNFWTNFYTRGTIGFLLSLSFIGLPILTGNWFEYVYCSLAIILTFALFAWRNLGEYTFNWKGTTYYICRSDVISFGVLGLAGMKIIF